MRKYCLLPLLAGLCLPAVAAEQPADDRPDAQPIQPQAAQPAPPALPASLPQADSPLALSTPLHGNLSTTAVVGLGAAAVAIGVALSNNGGGGGSDGERGSGATGTTQ
ncbi:hypothetical protein VV867_02560 [Pseudomonas sp. JH-2]|uniref:hypothetical protein n=1 Tax=Pseudomonas sp. JH-2 TaxID=3114998 RepID=UPI002E25C988|nr:hypothetical protein [Pseudomonas sp. JH-2]